MIVHPPAPPIGRRGRIGLFAAVLLIALVLGFAGGAILTQNAADAIRQSDGLGRMLCGRGHHVDRVPVPGRRRGYRLICRDAEGRQTGGRNNMLAIVFALPFILIVAVPGLWLAWKRDLRLSTRSRRR